MTDKAEPKLTITGHGVYDGDYPFDFDKPFTMRELHILKRISGARAGELSEAFAAGDSDVLLAVAVIAVRRTRPDWEAFEAIAWEAEAGLLELVFPEDDADDPPSTLRQQPGEPGNSNDSTTSTGAGSSNGSASYPEPNPEATGTSESDTSPISDPAILTT